MLLFFIAFGAIIITLAIISDPLRKKMKSLNGKVNMLGRGTMEIDGKKVSIMHEQGSRGKSPEFKLSIDGEFATNLIIRQETTFDRFYKNIGLNREFQSADPELNDAFYFQCDDEPFMKRLFANTSVKPLLMDVFNQVTSVEISPRACAFRSRSKKRLEEFTDDDLMRLCRQLLSFAACLPAKDSSDQSTQGAFKFWGGLLLTLSIFTLIAGIIAWIWGSASFRVVDAGSLWSLSLMYVIPIVLVSYVGAFAVIRGYANSSSVFLMFFMFFTLGALLLGRYGTAVYNGMDDPSAPHQFETTVIDRYTQTQKRSKTYYAVVNPWHEGMQSWAFSVPRNQYHHLIVGHTKYLITTKEGVLRFEWVVSEERMPDQTMTGNIFWPQRDYQKWYPLPAVIAGMPVDEYQYWRQWTKVAEDGVTNRLNVQQMLDVDADAANYRNIYEQYKKYQQEMRQRLTNLIPPERLVHFQQLVIDAVDKQIRFYEYYAEVRSRDTARKFNEFMVNDYLKESDKNLWAAFHYFQSLYPGIDKGANDAIERRLAELDII